MNDPKDSTAYEVVCCLALKDSQACHHLRPVAGHPAVSRLWIVRSRVSRHGAIPSGEYVLTPARFKPWRWVQMFRECLRLGRRPEVRAFVSFNPFPYGVIAHTVARRVGKPMHFGFIGLDWYRHVRGPLGPWLLRIVRDAAFVTATGEAMRADMIERGLDPARIAVLPHSIDVDRFIPGDPAKMEYACAFVGELSRGKRVDRILDAFAGVLTQCPDERLCVVGDGPARAALEAQVERLGIVESVTFTGFQRDVHPYLAAAKMNVIASDREGFPFSLVEGVCCGAIPVATRVGTIPDVIRDDENGLLVAPGDTKGMTEAMLRVLSDDACYARLRANVLQMRSEFSYDRATTVWDKWFEAL